MCTAKPCLITETCSALSALISPLKPSINFLKSSAVIWKDTHQQIVAACYHLKRVTCRVVSTLEVAQTCVSSIFAATYMYSVISGDESQPEKIWGMAWASAKNYGIFIVRRFITKLCL